jgi:hypothetical protein
MPGLELCGSNCLDVMNNPAHCGGCKTKCAKREACFSGVCGCRQGFAKCGEACVNLDSDPSNCGACGVDCSEDSACSKGVCMKQGCPGSATTCKGKKGGEGCVDTASDPSHCGSCEGECDTSEVCVAGSCAPYAPASPCHSCPCEAACAALLGDGTSCCPGAGDTASCVAAPSCPKLPP